MVATDDAADGPIVPPRLVLIVAVLSVGISAILIRYVHDAPARTIAFYRLFMTVVVLAPFAFGRLRAEFSRLSGRDLVLALGIGVVLAVHFASWIESLFHTSVASSVIIVSLESVFAAAGAAIFLGERLSRQMWAYIALAILGVSILAVGDAQANAFVLGSSALYGDFLALIGAIAAAVYFVGGRSLRPRVHIVVYALIVYWSCSVTLFVLAIGTGAPLAGFSGRTWSLFVLMAVFPTIGGHTLFNWSLRYLPAATVSTSVLGEPIIAAVLAAILFAEVPGGLAIVGGAITLIGILGAIRNEKRPDAAGAGLVEGAGIADRGPPP